MQRATLHPAAMSARHTPPLMFLLLGSVLLFPAEGSSAPQPSRSYEVLYETRIRPDCLAEVAITVDQNPGLLRELRIRIDPERHHDFAGDGRVAREAEHLVWALPAGRAQLRYGVRIDHLRGEGFDARCTLDYALFRAEDLFPPTATWVVPEGTPSRARFRLELPHGWKVVTPFRRRKDGAFTIEQPHRDHDRPTGWILAGRLGVQRETVAGVRLTIASPIGEGVHRLDLLALLRWTLPQLQRILPELPDRLLIVSARDPMWRGGLSGPRSLYLHGDRPLIERDGTSPLLHEVMHVLMRARAGSDGDWIVEGLAELYSLELLVRSKTISEARYRKSLDGLARRGAAVERLRVPRSTGTTTARAADLLHRLDRRIRSETGDRKSLDDVLRALIAADRPITTEGFRNTAERVTGLRLERFFRNNVR